MVSALASLVQRRWSGLHQAAFLLALSALASQLLALLRDRLLASTFGAGRTLDLYYTAFRIPDLVYVTIASFVSVTILIPILTRLVNKKEESSRLLSEVSTVFVCVMITVSFVLWIGMPTLSRFIAPGFSDDDLATLILLSRLMLLSPLLLGLSNIVGSVTQVHKRFFLYALAPVLYNVGIIIGILFLYPFFGTSGLAMGVVIGAIAHVLIQLPALSAQHIHLSWRFPSGRSWEKIWSIVSVSIPRTITLAAHQLALAGLFALASFLGAGAIAIFNLAWNLQSVPLSLFGVSYSVAAFPTLSRLAAKGDRDNFILYIRNTTRHLIFWSLPTAALIIVLRAHLVRVIYGAGEFDWVATRLTAAALALFVISLVAQNLVLLFVRGYYAVGKTRTPLIVNSLSSLGIVALAPILLSLFRTVPSFAHFIEHLVRVDTLVGTEILMIPLAFTIGLTINLCILWALFERSQGPLFRPLLMNIFQSLMSAVLVGVTTYYALAAYASFFNTHTASGLFGQGLSAGITGIVAGVALLILMDNQELRDMITSARQKIAPRRLVLPDPEEL